jgi:hypothetical protein
MSGSVPGKNDRGVYERILDQLDVKGRELLQELAEGVLPLLLDQAIREGRIDPRGKSEAELNKEFEGYLREQVEEGKEVVSGQAEGEVLVVFDYKTLLLREARRFATEGANEPACLFYATWLEHWLNQMIVTAAGRRGLSREEITQMIRDLSLRAKVSWVFPALSLPRLEQTHQGLAIELSDLRNAFVHYKWQGEPEDRPRQTALARAIERVEETVTYLEDFERREIYGENERGATEFVGSHGKTKD